jgi:hypothetical protein
MDEKVRYPIERSPFYPAHSFIIFFLCFDLFHCRSTLVLLASFIHIYMVWRTIMPIESKLKKKTAHANFFCVHHITRNENGAGSHRHTLWPLRDANDECSRSPPLAFSNGGKWISIFMRQMGSRRPLNKTGNRERAIRAIVLHI